MNRAPVGGGSKRRRQVLLLVAAAALAAALVATGWFVISRDRPDAPEGSVAGVPSIFPVPQHARVGTGAPVPLTGHVYIVAGSGTDQASIDAVQDLVVGAGGTTELVTAMANRREGSSAVYLGLEADSAVRPVLKELQLDTDPEVRDALGRAEGYAVATGIITGRPTAVLAGRDSDGVFHAVQTLRQLLRNGSVAAVRVSDWPLMETRGVIEGFYGTPWSHQARLDVIEFAGQQKMNTYIYSPKDDPLLRDKWRDLYSDQELRDLRELIDAASDNHVRFSYALSPGIDICYSRLADLDDAVSKLDSLYSLGVRSFVIPLDDIATKVQCDEDLQEFGSGQANLAKAQASFLNDVNERFISAKEGVLPLETVPTFYNGSASNAYKRELGKALNPGIVVQWTGEDVVSHRITEDSAEAAGLTYGTPGSPRSLVVWDNYPVNDFSQDHLFLAPVIGRDANLHKTVRGIVTNPMIQPYLSLPAIFNYADLSWNGPAYDPSKSMNAALSLIAGSDPEVQAAVRAFVDLNQDWQDDALTPSAPELRRDIDQFWADYDAGRSPSGGLKARAELLQRLPELLPRMKVPGFAQDGSTWIAAAAEYGRGVEEAVSMLEAAKRGDTQSAMQARGNVQGALTAAAAKTQPTLELGVVSPVLGDSELTMFLERALQEAPPN
ncbi:beta-N-acetylglucosaminidase [Arthrobacter sp. MYb23]|uniref:beta-N-acetylhexosaminidase family protein n=1 Tax=unclassified Arthrobacter TaxID=235627 RepID=UPI000CFB7253|nr:MULTISPECIES: beta-N-acetylglucosaminidase domain-containing protein [unclassified Arthrobacter]PRA20356.1 beta-N-acetylglucosaminidase [Brevundimonas sp. MYb27]PRB43821.1 beta-N-acetylglucosaminidase [Arthrobacter sp. MYb51]PRB97427.1 beta-N-acetylglucosaminidase [Arthrobacter sp. MYb23]